MFEPFPKIPRLAREIVVTEKIDGTNAQVFITPWAGCEVLQATPAAQVGEYVIYAGSRSRYLTPGKTTDNFGFAAWVRDNAEELLKLGPGRHFGEWWGQGIQRGYGLDHKRFSLFNVSKWAKPYEAMQMGYGYDVPFPSCCHVVPTLYRGDFDTEMIQSKLYDLAEFGSQAAPGFYKPEGLIVYHTASGQLFKKTLEGDDQRKSEAA